MSHQTMASASLAEAKPSSIDPRTPTGWIEHIHLSAGMAQPMVSRQQVEAIAGRGLAGDRYAEGLGFWRDAKVSRDVTLIEGEAVDALGEVLGPVEPGITRRNLTTRGVQLKELVGRTFRIGDVLARGTTLCTPCQHLAEVTEKPLLRPLAHRGGLRADLLTSGVIRVGDPISIVD